MLQNNMCSPHYVLTGILYWDDSNDKIEKPLLLCKIKLRYIDPVLVMLLNIVCSNIRIQ